LVKFIPIN